MKKWILCAVVFSLLFCGCGGPGKSPIVGKKTEVIVAWHLAKMDEDTYSKSWDDFSEPLLGKGIVDEDLEDLFEDLAEQNVAVVYRIINNNGAYLAFDVSSCKKKEKEEVEDILKDFSKELSDVKFYSTDQGFFYVGPDTPEFKKSVRNAKFQSWKKEECWKLVQPFLDEPIFLVRTFEKEKELLSISDVFPIYFVLLPSDLQSESEIDKYFVPLEKDDALKFRAKSIVGISSRLNPQKCVFTFTVTLDSRENAQNVQKFFVDYMSELAKLIDEKDVSDFLKSQKCKIVGHSVQWEFDTSWLKANEDAMEEFREAVDEYKPSGK